MSVTILAALFLVILLLAAILGYKGVIKRGKNPENLNDERCSVCGGQFNKSQLVERQVGDYRLYFFCASCITNLYNEMTSKN